MITINIKKKAGKQYNFIYDEKIILCNYTINIVR